MQFCVSTNPAKCVLGVSQLSYPGYIVSSNGFSTVPKCSSLFIQIPSSTNFHELRSIHGGLWFCARFIPNLTEEFDCSFDILSTNPFA